MRKRKGSIMALTLVMFAVLMILGTFILSFMVNENKQAIYYQNKTQAYYLAKAGADIAETAIVKHLYVLGKENSKEFIDNFDSVKDINLDYNIEGLNYIQAENKDIEGKRVLVITSSATYGDVEQQVKKVIYSNSTTVTNDGGGVTISGAPLVAIEKALMLIKKKGEFVDFKIPEIYAQIAGYDSIFKPHIFPNEPSWGDSIDYILENTELGTENEETNYVFSGNLTLKGNISIKGKVNIYVKGYLEMKDMLSLNTDFGSSHENLNIYVYNKYNASLGLKTPPKMTLYFKGNIYVRDGNIDLDIQKTEFEGNLISNGNEIRIGTQDSSNKDIIRGSIYAPNSDIYIGYDKSAILLDGKIVGKNILLKSLNENKTFEFLNNMTNTGEVTIPVETGTSNKIDVVQYFSYYSD